MKTSIGSIAACAAIVFFAPQLLPVAAVQQGGQEAASQEVAEAEDADSPENSDANEGAAALEEGSDNPWKQVFTNDEMEVIDIAQKMSYADAEVSRRRAAELADTVRQVIPFNDQIRASAADGLLIVVGDEAVRMLARDIADRMIAEWNLRGDKQRVTAQDRTQQRIRRLIMYRDNLEHQFKSEYEKLMSLELSSQAMSDSGDQTTEQTEREAIEIEMAIAMARNRVDALQESITRINRELIALDMDD